MQSDYTIEGSVFMLEQKLRAAENDATSSKGIQEPMSSGEHWTPTQSHCLSHRVQSDYSVKGQSFHA